MSVVLRPLTQNRVGVSMRAGPRGKKAKQGSHSDCKVKI